MIINTYHLATFLVIGCFSVLTEGFFLPIFVRKQPPQTPAVNNAQWAPSLPAAPAPQYQEKYAHYSNPSMAMTPLQPVQQPSMASSMNHLQYSYDPIQATPYSQMQFHSVQLVPCLCPLSKDVIEQQTQQLKQQQAAAAQAVQQPAEQPSNSVLVQSTHKVNS